MGIPNMSLPELRPVQTENPMDQYAKALQIRQMNQQGQIGGIQLQQAQRAKQDSDAFRSVMQDPSMKGKTLGEIADVLLQGGHISQEGYVNAKKADVEQRKNLADLDEKTLANRAASHAQTQNLYNNVMNMPDDQLAQNWGSIAQQYDSIPGNKPILDPAKPLTKQAIAQMGPMLDMHDAYLSGEVAKRKAAADAKTSEAELPGKVADSAIKTAEADQMKQGALPQNLADMKYRTLQQNIASGQPIGLADKAFIKAYEKQKLLVPTASANIRVEGMMNAREYPVFDKKSGSTIMATPEEINRAAKEEPGRYTAPSYTPEAVGAKDTTAYFTKGKGGQQLTAFNTAITHLDTLDRLAGDLQNTDIRVFNRAKQEWATQTGGAAPANFDAAKNAMSGEVAAALKASGATDQEIAHVGATFDKAQSPAQLKGSINTYRELLKSKEVQLKKQYDSGMQGKPAFEGAQQPGAQSAPQAGGGWAEQFGGVTHK